ncbi:TPR domain protein, putative component of TonB system [Labilithrix luteola]|uniref:TPR domain protein, putative component of TonB system n=1 Tax=Labilithrix luteola TaxID=1391654 RepID=A0A0K1QC99_9BACT|nr:tetratricopeptide repeat protein [Labilithrix luteola]AKV03060.1 TPR domain protein, putative component of TonB system [Labilithrix luteola]
MHRADRLISKETVRELLTAAAFLFAVLGMFSTAGCASVPPLPPKAIELNRDGAAALAAGDLLTAEARLAVAIEYSPRFTEAWVNLGYVELRRGNLTLARKHFVKARDLNSDLPAPHHALGVLADRRDLGREAEANYRQALKVDPGFAPARVNLARRLFARGAFEDAREQFLRLTQVQADVPAGYIGLAECLLRLDREPEADDVLARARARFGDTPELTMLVARQLLRREAFAEAEEILAPLTDDADKPRAASAWAWIGVSRLARGDRHGATDAAHEALAIDREDAVARDVLAKAH